jgi:holo-[acyl-carrier protein] synthase
VIVGVGTDLVDVQRFRRVLERRPRLAPRLFSDAERAYTDRHRNAAPRLAARFAAKEAVMKALGVGLGAFKLREVEVVRQPNGAPEVALYGAAAELAARQNVQRWLLSLSHTDITAIAIAMAVG